MRFIKVEVGVWILILNLFFLAMSFSFFFVEKRFLTFRVVRVRKELRLGYIMGVGYS